MLSLAVSASRCRTSVVRGGAVVAVLGGGGQREHRGRVLGLLRALLLHLDPAHDLLVGVRLDRLEDEFVGVLGQLADGERELLEEAGLDALAGRRSR